MFKSELLLDRKLTELGYDFQWVYPKSGHSYGFDLWINGYRVEVKETNFWVNFNVIRKTNNKVYKYKYPMMRINLHKHGIKENNVDYYVFLILDTFYIVPADKFHSKTVSIHPKTFVRKMVYYKENWELLKNV